MLSRAVALMVLLMLCPVLARRAGAQECQGAKQRIYQITESEAQQDPDSLQTVLALTAFVRDCENQVSLDLELWLLINEVFSLDGLERYEEASDLVDHFFANYFDHASDSYRASFYIWQLHFDALSGNAIGMVVAYNAAKAYAGALSAVHEAHLHLNGAYAYREINDFETALNLVREARALIGQPATFKDSLALARVFRAGAETQLRVGTRLQQVQDDLRAAAKLYSTLGDTSQVANATTLLGETYAALGDTSTALAEMATAVALSREAGSVRSRIAALYRQGHLLRLWGDSEAALQSLSQTLNISDDVREFRLRTLFGLARLYEQRRDYDKATSYHQAVIDASQPGGLAAELEAARQAREGRIRILLIEQERNRMLLWLALAGVLFLLGLVGVGLYLHVHQNGRRQAIYEQIRESIVLPDHLKTGLSLSELERRFQKNVNSELLGKRLARSYALLFDPGLVLSYIDDEYLKPQVEAGKLENNTALFECVAAVARAIEDRTFQSNAANTMRSYLLGEFRKRSWEWPKNPLAWKRYFLEHHMKTLF